MELHEKEILRLISETKDFISENKEKLRVTKILPQFIYKCHPFLCGDFDLDLEGVAELTIEGEAQIYRLCCWYNTKSKKLFDKILVMPSNLSYLRVETLKGEVFWFHIEKAIYDYIIQCDNFAFEHHMRCITISYMRDRGKEIEEIKESRLYDNHLSAQGETVVFTENLEK